MEVYKQIKGTFDGLHMIGENGVRYKVPPNYVSKSKLLEGDKLILRIMDTGDMIYKVIKESIPIKFIGQFQNGKIWNKDNQSFSVISSTINYFHLEDGDEVIALTSENSRWAAVEAKIGKTSDEEKELEFEI